jgi:hypothetical protein
MSVIPNPASGTVSLKLPLVIAAPVEIYSTEVVVVVFIDARMLDIDPEIPSKKNSAPPLLTNPPTAENVTFLKFAVVEALPPVAVIAPNPASACTGPLTLAGAPPVPGFAPGISTGFPVEVTWF